MGIKNFAQVFGEDEGEVIVPLDTFDGKKIGIDASQVCCAHWNIAYKDECNRTRLIQSIEQEDGSYINQVIEEIDLERVREIWLGKFLRAMNAMKRRGSTLLFVFDGIAPEEKKQEQLTRQETRQKAKDKIKLGREKLLEADQFDQDEIINGLRSNMSNASHPRKEDKDVLKDVLFHLGYSVITAEGESDPLLAALAITGLIDAVFSSDTDMLIYGTPVLITGMATDKPRGSRSNVRCKNIGYNVYYLDKILEDLEITQTQLEDLAICLGCDYNNKTKLYGVNPRDIWRIIKLRGCIENIETIDTKPLQHEKCRKMFKLESPEDMVKKLDLTPKEPDEESREFLEQYELTNFL